MEMEMIKLKVGSKVQNENKNGRNLKNLKEIWMMQADNAREKGGPPPYLYVHKKSSTNIERCTLKSQGKWNKRPLSVCLSSTHRQRE